MGLFITIEGIEGSGKSTLQKSLTDALRSHGRTVCVTREPGGTALGVNIRKLLLEQSKELVTPSAELFLFAADRAQHVARLIAPALERDEIVLCDRFTHSTLAYQGFGRGMDIEELTLLNEIATSGLRPDLVLLLDLDPLKGLKRARGRGDDSSWTRFEAEALEFHSAVRKGFLTLAAEEAETVAVLNAEQSPEVVLAEALKRVEKQLSSHTRETKQR
jgi:dTMP kinase